jgi:hypothetical protein
MKRTRNTLLIAAVAAALGPASTAMGAGNPGQTCADSGNMELGSRGACASSVTKGEPSNAAYVANCKAMEPMFAADSPSGRPYPYSFYGNPAYTARNRRDCVVLLQGFHSGELPPGPGA